MTTDKIRDKIRKLFALAKGNTQEGERDAALAKARELMDQYAIEHVEELEADGITIVQSGWFAHFPDIHTEQGRWRSLLHASIGELYHSRGMISADGWLAYIGLAHNVEAAEETFRAVYAQTKELHKSAEKLFRLLRKKPNRKQLDGFQSSFCTGVALKVAKRVAEIIAVSKNQIPAHRALVVVDQAKAKVDELLAAMGGETRQLEPFKSKAGMGAGFVAGGTIKLQEHVEE